MKRIVYILKKGNVSPDEKQKSETKYNFYTLWKQTKTTYSSKGELIRGDKNE